MLTYRSNDGGYIEQLYKISKEIYEDIEQLQQENTKYKEVIDKLNKYMYSGYLINSKEIKDILKEVE